MFDNTLQTAILLQQFSRGFRTNTVNAGNVIYLIAHQRQIIDDLLWCQTKLFFYGGDIGFAVIHGVDQRHMLADQLRHILVAGGNHRFNSGSGSLFCQRANYIVGFHVINAQQRQTHGFNNFVNRCYLFA